MPSILLTGPAVEPLSLDDAKAYLRVATSDDDDVITALIASARLHVEAQTRRALITQSWRIVRDAWPADGIIRIVPVPLQAIAAARVYDVDGNAQEIDVQAFVPDTAAAPAVIAFAPWSLPLPGREQRRDRDRRHARLWRCGNRCAGAAQLGDPQAGGALV